MVNRTPVDDTAFAQIAEIYQYDPDLSLDAVTIGSWSARMPYTIDKVIYTSTHGERIPGHFAYPGVDRPGPHPAILLVHGANSFWGRNEDWALDWLDILARAGYCVLCIDNADHGERMTSPSRKGKAGSYSHREWMVQSVTDQRRGVDYLRTRPEVDEQRILLFGGSLGGWIGCLVAGLDNRFAAVVLTVIGAWVEGATDDARTRWVNMLNFAPRLQAPTLMVNATGDGRELGEELFSHLPEPRQQLWIESSHYLPPREHNVEILNWLAALP
jgi:dienelactone hydrolase